LSVKIILEIPRGDSLYPILSMIEEERDNAENIRDERVRRPIDTVLTAFITVLRGYANHAVYARQGIRFTASGYNWSFDPYLENTITALRYKCDV